MNLENGRFQSSSLLRFFSLPFRACCSVEWMLVLYDWLKAYCDFHSILGFKMKFQTQSKGFMLNLFFPLFQITV